ncbi:MAG: T9SS type A sorting domain-containing protein [Bacteroidetes bacterium]|nr:T9SS type A sorting domain-containing protein [Bacteroidota bacterium]
MNLRFFALFIFFIGSNFQLHSQSILSSEMDIVYSGGSKLKLLINYYRDCRGDSVGKSDWKLRWFVANDTGVVNGNSMNASWLNRTGIKDVTPRCSTQSGPCKPQNGQGGEGVEQHKLELEIDLSYSPFSTLSLGNKNCILGFLFSPGRRAGAFTTGVASTEQWISGSINFCNLNNCLLRDIGGGNYPQVPFSFACCNQAFHMFINPNDTFYNDTFSNELIPCMADYKGISASYTSPYEYKYPLSSYCVTPTTIKCSPNIYVNPPRGFYFGKGAMIFTPVKCDETAVVAYSTTKWRKNNNGVFIPITTFVREIAISVKDDCSYNYPPKITGPAVNKVCEGEKICFDISAADATFIPYQTIPDTVVMNWNKGIPGSTFVIKNPNDREKTAQFCWQTKVGQASDVAYAFTVSATDNHCPKPGISILGFKVLVNYKAFDTRKYTCMDSGRIAVDAKLPEGFRGIAQYKWSIRDSNGIKELFFSTKKTDTFPLTYGGKYIVIHTINNDQNCPSIYRDTIQCFPINIKDLNLENWRFKNPVSSGEYLQLPENFKGKVNWYTSDGKLVFLNEKSSIQIMVPPLNPGVYFIELEQGDLRQKTKILIH